MNKPHVLPGAELSLGDLDEVWSAQDLAQRLPDLDVRVVIGDVAIENVVVQGHGAVAGNSDGKPPPLAVRLEEALPLRGCA